MTAEPSSPRSSGQAVRVCQGLPPVEMVKVERERPPGPRSAGQAIRVCQGMPPVEMVAVPHESVCLELTLTLAQAADAEQVFGKVVKWVEGLHAYEQSLGGAGVQWDRQRSAARPGTVQLVLVPNRPADAAQHLRSLGELVRETVAEFKDVQTVSARVSPHAA